MHGQLVKARRTVKAAGNLARDLGRVLAVLEELENPDIVGRYVVRGGERVDHDELRRFLNLCRQDLPEQDLTIVVLGPGELRADETEPTKED